MWSLLSGKRKGAPQRASFAQNIRINPGVCQSRPGTSTVLPVTGRVTGLYNWITPGGENLVLFLLGATGGSGAIKSYDATTATLNPSLLSVTGMRRPTFADIDTWTYFCGYDTSGVGVIDAHVYDGTFVDTAFAPPVVLTACTPVDGGPGQCTAGTHYLGFVYENRTGYSGKPSVKVATTPIQVTLGAGLRKINISVTLPALTDGGPNGSNSIQSTLFLIATRADNPAKWYFVPAATGASTSVQSRPVPHNAVTTLNFVMDISDEDLAGRGLPADNQFDLATVTDFSGKPSFVVPYGQRMCYGFGVNLYASDINNPQQVTLDENVVVTPNQRTIGYAFPLQGSAKLFVTGDRWTSSVNDDADVPATWSPPVGISGAIGAPFPGCVCYKTGGNYAWVVTENGCYLFTGTYSERPVTYLVGDQWARVNWKAAYAIETADDTVNLRFYIAVPMDGATEPTHMFVIDYTNGIEFNTCDITLDIFASGPFSSIGVVKEQATDVSNLWIGPTGATSAASATPSVQPIPPILLGWTFSDANPQGEFAFEYSGRQYFFLNQSGVGPGGTGDFATHALYSTDLGVTWTELDAAGAVPQPTSAGTACTVLRDGATVFLLWTRRSRVSGRPSMDGITVQQFNLTTGTWGTPKNYARQQPTGPWFANTPYIFGDGYIDGAGHTQVVIVTGTTGGSLPAFSTTGGTVVDGTVTWRDQGIGTYAKWLANWGYDIGATVVDGAGHAQIATTLGTSGGSLPTFSDTGGTTVDNTVTWLDIGVAAFAPANDFVISHQAYIQLVKRGPGDYIFCYSGPKESFSGTSDRQSRFYYATFDGTNFGAGVELPDQAGHTYGVYPYSAVADSSGTTHFVYARTGDGTPGPGITVFHIGLSSGLAFGTTTLITDHDAVVGHTRSAGSSQLIVYNAGAGETVAFVNNIYESSDPNGQVSLRLWSAPVALNPTWSSAVIAVGIWGGIQYAWPDNSDITPQTIALSYQNSRLTVTWIENDGFPVSAVPDEDYALVHVYEAHTVAGVWQAPAIILDVPAGLPSGTGRFTHTTKATQLFMWPMTGAVGIVAVWTGYDNAVNTDNHLAEFVAISTASPSAGNNIVHFDAATTEDQGFALDAYWESGLARGAETQSKMIRIGAGDIWVKGAGTPLVTWWTLDHAQSATPPLEVTAGVTSALSSSPGLVYMNAFDLSQTENYTFQFRVNAIGAWFILSSFAGYTKPDLFNR